MDKIGSPWIEPTTSVMGAPLVNPVRAHREKTPFRLEHRCGAGLRPLGVRINRRNGMEKLAEENCWGCGWGCRADDNCAGVVGGTG